MEQNVLMKIRQKTSHLNVFVVAHLTKVILSCSPKRDKQTIRDLRKDSIIINPIRQWVISSIQAIFYEHIALLRIQLSPAQYPGNHKSLKDTVAKQQMSLQVILFLL